MAGYESHFDMHRIWVEQVKKVISGTSRVPARRDMKQIFQVRISEVRGSGGVALVMVDAGPQEVDFLLKILTGNPRVERAHYIGQFDRLVEAMPEELGRFIF